MFVNFIKRPYKGRFDFIANFVYLKSSVKNGAVSEI